MSALPKLSEFRKSIGYYLSKPVVRFLAKTGIPPNAVTWFGFLLIILTAILIPFRHLLAAGILILVSSYFDLVDGGLARQTNRVTRFGGILDSTLDRLSDAVLFLGILSLYAIQQDLVPTIMAGAALVTCFTVSYIRARAEAAGLECKVGILTRGERIIILALGLLINQIFIALCVITAFSLFTIGQRLIHVWQQSRKKDNAT